ncbi:MAG: hypothetical protein ACRDH2_17505, partial [Anaerolineales bacterium]
EAEEDDGVLRADDPIFKMIGMYSSGVTDASVNHDYYLYGAPKREPDEARPIKVVREKRVTRYPPKSKRPTRKRSTK